MLGTQEIILIVFVIIILFGASKIPELARSLGKATGEFKRAKHETELELRDIEKPVKEREEEILKKDATFTKVRYSI